MRTSNDFVNEKYVKRDYAIAMTKQEDGRQALDNLLYRDVLFAEHMYQQAENEGFKILDINDDDDFEIIYTYLSEKWFLG